MNAAQSALRLAKAEGGVDIPRAHMPHIEGQKPVHEGAIVSSVAGRTDHLPMPVRGGSYVIPADIVSSHGQGNTAAGFKVMRRVFGGQPYGGGSQPYNASGGPYGEKIGHAKGGKAGDVPIVAAGGEYVITPEEVRRVGDGDLDMGHRVLDEFVKRSRRELVKTLVKLPGPRRD
jgi:hypothetical protein